MGARVKVYGVTLHMSRERRKALLPNEADHRAQCRAIVATTSIKAAAQVFGVSAHYLSGYGGETGNETEIEVAMAKPGVLFIAPLDGVRTAADYVEVPPGT